MSLGTKLNLALLGFLLLLGAATSAIIFFGFGRTQDIAQERSNEALEEQGKLALLALVGGISEQGSVLFEAAAATGRRSALYIESQPARDAGSTVDTSDLALTESGLYYDPNPGRTSDLVLLNGVSPDAPGVQDDIAFSAPLDDVLPVLFQSFSGETAGQNFDPTAIIFISTSGASRYYPPIGVQEFLPPDVDIANRMANVGPVNNPERRTIWTAPYEDAGGQGKIVTARTPVYEGDTLRGSLEVDLSIANLIDQLNQIRPTPGGFSFYVDSGGSLFETDTYELITTEAAQGGDIAAVLEGMKGNQPGDDIEVVKINLDGQDFFVAYAPILTPGGSIAVAAPVSDVTANAATITAGIDDEASRTIRFMLGAMGVLFIAGLAGAAYLNRQVIAKPIGALAAATRAVAGGDLSANVPLARGDELGLLAGSFNIMVEQLRESERALEQRVEDRTRELGTLLEVSRSVASSIELDPLLESVLDRVRTVADYDRGSVQVFEDGQFTARAVRDFGGGVGYRTQLRPGMQFPALTGPLWSQFEADEPIIINDIKGDSPAAHAYRDLLHPDVNADAILAGSFMAIPLISQDTVVGRISIGRDATGFYTADHARLARAIASQVAIAIQNARSYEASQLRARETEALLRADRELFRSLSLDAVLQSLVDVAVDVLGADKCLVTLWDRGRNTAAVRAARNFSPKGLELFGELLPSPGLGSLRDDVEPTVHKRLDDPSMPAAVRAIMELEGVVAAMDVPIRSSAGEVLGGYGVAYADAHEFGADERRLLGALADRAAVAIHNAKLLDESQRQAKETEALLRADAELFRSLSLDAVLQSLVDIAVDVLGAGKSMVLLHEGQFDVIRAVRNVSPETVREFNESLSRIPHEEPPPEGQNPQIYEDLSEAPEFIAAGLSREGVASHISLPVRDQHRMLGIFGVSFLEKRTFTQDDLRLYSALADRAAAAIQNAELYEKAQHAASLEERQRLARELHDSVSQALYGIALGARTARLRIDEDPARAAEPIEYVTSLAEAGLAEMRALIFELRPESLETEGLIAAIDKQVASIRARHQIAIDAELGDEPDCRIEVKEALYRIAQEALQNVIKHAQATHVRVLLERTNGALVLTIADDGRGFDTEASFPGHIGMHSMLERAAKVSGEVSVESTPESGTRVVARVPL